jgi:hypothetical protein
MPYKEHYLCTHSWKPKRCTSCGIVFCSDCATYEKNPGIIPMPWTLLWKSRCPKCYPVGYVGNYERGNFVGYVYVDTSEG